MTGLAEADEEAATRWLAIAAAVASISVVGIAIGLGVPLLSVILEQQGYSSSLIGMNTAVAGFASIAAAPLATPIACRVGIVPTMLAMILLGAVAIVGFHVAGSFWMWFPLRIILHAAITILFILSEYWITASAPPHRRGFVLGIYATVLSLGFAAGPWIFAHTGSQGFLPFGVAAGLVLVAAVPVMAAWKEEPPLVSEGNPAGFARFLWLVPTATAAVIVFGAVETGGFSLFPVYAAGIGYSQPDAALLLTMIGLGNVILQIPIGMISDRLRDRRLLLLLCALIGLAGTILMPYAARDWHMMAPLLFVWGGVVAALYTVGLAHLATRLSGRDLASANAAFVLCYGVGMVLGPQAIGIGMDVLGENGFGWTLSMFFASYVLLVVARIAFRPRQP